MSMKLLSKILSIKYLSALPVAMLLSVVLAGCSSDGDERPGYMDAATVKSLEIPPKLSIPDTQGALRLPEPSQQTAQQSASAMRNTPIAPTFSGFDLKQDSGLYWLEIDMPVADVWKTLPDFLASEGIEVDRVEKLLGFLDTAWMSEYKVTYNSEASGGWFSSFSPDYKDRFRIRVEAIDGTNKTRLFVNHRGLQISVANDVTAWTQRDSEPFLEREVLYRYVLFSGINKTAATELLASYHGYQPRVDKITDTSDSFSVKGEADTIWMRLQIAMDRLGVDIVKSDKASRSMQVLVGSMHVEEQPPEDDSGWFGGLFSGKKVVVDEGDDYEDDDAGNDSRKVIKVAPQDRITLQLQQIVGEGSSEIKLSNIDASPLTGDLVWQFRDAVLAQLK